MCKHANSQTTSRSSTQNTAKKSPSSGSSNEHLSLSKVPKPKFGEEAKQEVEKDFICKEHIKGIEKACRVGNFAVSFRQAGEPTLKALSKGAAAKGHDILEKTIKPGSIEKAYRDQGKADDVKEKVRKASIEGYVGHWNKDTGHLEGIYLSSGHGLSLRDIYQKNRPSLSEENLRDKIERNIYPINLDNLETSLASLKAKSSWAALPFTGDYDMHDMINFTTKPHSIPSESPDEKRIKNLINKYICEYDKQRPFEDTEHNVIRHGPQVNYIAFAMDKEKEQIKKNGGLVKAVAEPGEFPVAIASKRGTNEKDPIKNSDKKVEWTIVYDIHQLQEFYERVGAKLKVTWNPNEKPMLVPNSVNPNIVTLKTSSSRSPKT
ncbi:Insecticial toxin [Photorhabdus sp. RM323S]|uniref:Insecticial toxin n=1 Tax=Photorhabdus sp. RM323S TaxID=3342828 RepID=UPI0036D912EC